MRVFYMQSDNVSSPTLTRLQNATRVCGGGREEEGGPRLKCGGFSYVEGPLRMGELWGNQFSVVVRGARVSSAAASAMHNRSLHLHEAPC